MEFFVGGYFAVAVYLMLATSNWHVKHDSPPAHMLHDILVAAVWPLEVVARIWRAHQ